MILRRLFCGMRLCEAGFYIQKMSQDCCPWSLWCSGFQGKFNHNSIIFTPSVLSTLGAISKPHSFSRSHPILLSPHRASLGGGLKWQCFIHSGPNSGSPSHKAFEISEMKLVGFMGLHDVITYNYSWTWGATVHKKYIAVWYAFVTQNIGSFSVGIMTQWLHQMVCQVFLLVRRFERQILDCSTWVRKVWNKLEKWIAGYLLTIDLI